MKEMQVSVHEAKTQLSHLLNLIEDGEQVIIQRHGKAIARLVPAQRSKKSPLGAMQGEFEFAQDWDRPLTNAEADAFWKGNW
jgi:prevent-host-death family protein